MKKNLPRICLKCWCQIIEFHSFKHSVLLAQTKLSDHDFATEQAIVKSENLDLTADPYVVAVIREEAQRMERTESQARAHQVRHDEPHLSQQPEPTVVTTSQPEILNMNTSCENFPQHCLTNVRISQYRTFENKQVAEAAQFHDESMSIAAAIKNEGGNISRTEIELIDIPSDSQASSDEDEEDNMPLMLASSSHCKAQTNDNSKDGATDDESDGALRDMTGSPLPRKSAQELDEIIAHWRPILECLICCRPCTTFTILENHYHQHHPTSEFFILCCQMKFNNRRCIEEHILLHSDPGLFKCKICGKMNTTRRNLKSHMTYWHSETNRDKLLCTECGKMSKTPGALRRHKQRHNAKREIKCTTCGQEFMDRKVYFEHLRTHRRPNYHYCSDCPKSFKHRSGLRVHRQKEHSKITQLEGVSS